MGRNFDRGARDGRTDRKPLAPEVKRERAEVRAAHPQEAGCFGCVHHGEGKPHTFKGKSWDRDVTRCALGHRQVETRLARYLYSWQLRAHKLRGPRPANPHCPDRRTDGAARPEPTVTAWYIRLKDGVVVEVAPKPVQSIGWRGGIDPHPEAPWALREDAPWQDYVGYQKGPNGSSYREECPPPWEAPRAPVVPVGAEVVKDFDDWVVVRFVDERDHTRNVLLKRMGWNDKPDRKPPRLWRVA